MSEQAEGQKTETRLLKKMTPKHILGSRPKVPESPTHLFTIYGVAKGVRKGEGTYGPWTMLVGNFEATRDGVRYIAVECALPHPMHDLIIDALLKNEGKDVQFAANVTIHPRPDTAIGYEYFANPIIDQTENDPLSDLRQQVTKALTAPVKETTKAPEEPEEDHGKKTHAKK